MIGSSMARLAYGALLHLPLGWQRMARKANAYLTGRYPVDAATQQRIVRELKEVRAAASGPTIAFVANSPWQTFTYQRPQQLAAAFADLGVTVLYCEMNGFMDEYLNEQGRADRDFIGVRKMRDGVFDLRAPTHVIVDLVDAFAPDAQLLQWHYQYPFLGQAGKSKLIYEQVDEHSLDRQPYGAWAKFHARLLRDADIVTVTSRKLYEATAKTRPDVLLLPNGTRLDDWRLDEKPPVPDDLRAARNAPVLVGCYGMFDYYFDFDLWEGVAMARPDWSFVLLGNVMPAATERVNELLARCPNTYHLERRPYNELPPYLAHFDIATVPFALSEMTHAVSPIKMFEYMAGGKPIVATPMNEAKHYESVLIAATADEFAAALDRALALRDDPEYQRVLDKEANENTWHARAGELIDAIGSRKVNPCT